MANIERRTENTYRITVSAGYSTSGKKLRKYKTVTLPENMTQRQRDKELQRQAVLFEEQVRSGRFFDSNIKFQQFSEVWMREYSERQHKAQTIISNREALKRLNAGIGHIPLHKLQPHHILGLLGQMEEPGQNKKTGGGLSAKTILNHHRVLSSILSTAVHWGVIADNPAKKVKPPKLNRREAKSLDDRQAVLLLEAIEHAPEKYKLAVELLLFSGMRRGELLALTWSDVDFENCTVAVNKSSLYLPGKGIYEDTTKNESSNRTLKLPQRVISHLRAFRSHQAEEQLKLGDAWLGNGRIFTQWDGQPMHPDSMTRWLSRFIQQHNERIDKLTEMTSKQREALYLPAISPHALRHTNASLLIASGVNLRTAASRLGHAQTSTTANIYSHAIRTADAIASDALESVLIKKSV